MTIHTQIQNKSKNLIVLDEIKFRQDDSDEQKQKTLTLLNELRDWIAKDIYEIGKSYILELIIKENPNSKIVNCKTYKVTIEDRKKIKDIVTEWKE